MHDGAGVPRNASVPSPARVAAAVHAPAKPRARSAVQVRLQVFGRRVAVVRRVAGVVVAAHHHVDDHAAVLGPLQRRLHHVGADVVDRGADGGPRRRAVDQVDDVVQDAHVLRDAAAHVGEVRLHAHRALRGRRHHARRSIGSGVWLALRRYDGGASWHAAASASVIPAPTTRQRPRNVRFMGMIGGDREMESAAKNVPE